MSDLKIGDKIMSIEQLEALPEGSVVRTDMAVVAQKLLCNNYTTDDWATIGTEDELVSQELAVFPVTVLWVGGEQQ